QCVGYEGIDKRIDQIALLIKKGGTVYDLMKVEHAYAPPYSSAKDPIAIGGYVAGNILNGSMPVISWREMQQVNREESYLLDVRTADEYKLEAIAGSVNIPLDELRNRLAEIPTDRQIYVYCGIGLRGYMALKILVQRGFTKVKNLSGGYKTYSLAIAPVANQQKMMDPHEEKHHDGEQKKSLNLKIVKVDACGLQCPGPILKLKKSMEEIQEGDCIEISSTDPGFARDAQAWCNSTGNNLLSNTFDKGVFTILIEKGALKGCNLTTSCDSKGKTFIMFSDDLDKALATFVLANGAAATGQKTTIFFTFWGLNVIKKTEKPSVEKDIFGKMFSWMLPSHSLKLKLSKMNMLGIGSKMMRYIMKKKNIESLESLRKQAIEQRVELIACQMSMEVMGVKREELLEEVTVGGVATYMERADNANVNLFI
ncbi:MAG: DsrE/DsrF/DrsH-like family protein, partial [Bacteroidales bacterium]